ncbi:MAG: hypothetical protein D8M59_12930 [Planctomycetes bacterium]|nr:hypothetical protein [Planctomycetota bacterium]NOG54913.1 hypothetical protein [Planctomycetota bacterium]
MPGDGQHTAPEECYDYAFGLCPDPLGAANCFYASKPMCLQLSIDNNDSATPSTLTLCGLKPFGTGAVLYSLKTNTFLGPVRKVDSFVSADR